MSRLKLVMEIPSAGPNAWIERKLLVSTRGANGKAVDVYRELGDSTRLAYTYCSQLISRLAVDMEYRSYGEPFGFR